MRQSYCFKCGCYTAIDDTTKLCVSCYEHWKGTGDSRGSAGAGSR